MISEECKKMAKELVKKAQEKGLITKYSEWCKTEEAKEYENYPDWVRQFYLLRFASRANRKG